MVPKRRPTLVTLALAACAVALLGARGLPIPPSPSESAAKLHGEIIKKYLAADWDTLAADLAKQRDIAAMTKDQQAEVAYIRTALAECRPAWWAQVKLGRPITIRPTVWQRTFVTNWDPTLNSRLHIVSKNQQVTLSVYWSPTDMDSNEPLYMKFTKADRACLDMWDTLEVAEVWIGANLERLARLAPAERNLLDRYTNFRGALTGLYYGTPRARQFGVFGAFRAISDSSPAGFPRRPIASMLAAEFVSRPDRYPSLKIPKELSPENAETQLANDLARQIANLDDKWTLAEDRALREALKDFAAANAMTVFNTGKATLPNKQVAALDVQADAELAVKRNKWLSETAAKDRNSPGVLLPPVR